jgi:predicted ArsR family transcriptional regulator
MQVFQATDLPASDMPQRESKPTMAQLDLPVDRDSFLRALLGNLADALEGVIGLRDASGFVSIVGQRIGEDLSENYRKALHKKRLSRAEVAEALVDFERRIHGDFYVIEQDDEKIVLGNRACPFAERVYGHPSLCMMTSGTFGVIAAQNLGYARVDLEKMIAQGHRGCRVVIYLKPPADSARGEGREYYEV